MSDGSPSTGAWIKSSYSGDNADECVEVAPAGATVLVRDSMRRHGPVLTFPTQAWGGFVERVAKGKPPE